MGIVREKEAFTNSWTFITLFFCLYIPLYLASGFSDTAYFGGDTLEYQSTAVNFAKGHGIVKIGNIEDFECYEFGHC